MRWMLVLVMVGLCLAPAAARETARSATCASMAADRNEPNLPPGFGFAWGEIPDLEQAIDICRLALDELPGDAVIMFRLARALMQAERYAEAMPLMLKSAEAGYAPAEAAYGTAALNGRGLQQDNKQAQHWLERAVAQNHPVALNNLATMYAKGGGLPRNDREAMRLYALAAELGYAPAQANLGMYYVYAIGTEYNPAEAQRLLELSAAQDDAFGKTLLAEMLLRAPGVSLDPPRAITLLTQAAIAGQAMAHRLLGIAYADGYYVDYDPFAALVHLERAYADGDAEAAYRLAFLYGSKKGVGLDEARAQDYLLKAAEQGFPHALYYAGRNYYYGLWTAPDAEKADYWLGRAALMGVPEAQFLYAEMLLQQDRPELVDKALNYAERAGYGGEARGFILLAEHYLEREQWERAHGYGSLAMQTGDEEVKNLARRVFEAVEPHLKQPQQPMAGNTAGLG